ncbi:Lrp/AsnC family transcriptional regulator [Leucobacter albus]|uniref:Lrp/AsnC family transcriptional regulator n=1 Tax=Leucobacter albus TaxID=272210 RepID=A0ABW3TL32_9MICO
MIADGLNDLQRRIIAALQVDGRAPWRKIAEALGEPERTVARYGNELLESGRVVIAAVDHFEHSMILACTSAAGTARLSGEALAQRDDVTFSYLTTGTADVVAEIGYRDNLGELLTTRLPATAGVQSFSAMPILRYFKTIRGWRTGALTETETEALVARTGPDRTEWSLPESRGPKDDELIGALKADGRVSIEALARRAKMSETSVARRVEWLLSSGQFSIRALVDPALVGFEVEAILWARVASYRVEALGNELRQWPEVRYAAAIAGDAQLMVNVTAASHHELYQLLARPAWEEHETLVSTDLIIEARKRGGRAV